MNIRIIAIGISIVLLPSWGLAITQAQYGAINGLIARIKNKSHTQAVKPENIFNEIKKLKLTPADKQRIKEVENLDKIAVQALKDAKYTDSEGNEITSVIQMVANDQPPVKAGLSIPAPAPAPTTGEVTGGPVGGGKPAPKPQVTPAKGVGTSEIDQRIEALYTKFMNHTLSYDELDKELGYINRLQGQQASAENHKHREMLHKIRYTIDAVRHMANTYKTKSPEFDKDLSDLTVRIDKLGQPAKDALFHMDEYLSNMKYIRKISTQPVGPEVKPVKKGAETEERVAGTLKVFLEDIEDFKAKYLPNGKLKASYTAKEIEDFDNGLTDYKGEQSALLKQYPQAKDHPYFISATQALDTLANNYNAIKKLSEIKEEKPITQPTETEEQKESNLARLQALYNDFIQGKVTTYKELREGLASIDKAPKKESIAGDNFNKLEALRRVNNIFKDELTKIDETWNKEPKDIDTIKKQIHYFYQGTSNLKSADKKVFDRFEQMPEYQKGLAFVQNIQKQLKTAELAEQKQPKPVPTVEEKKQPEAKPAAQPVAPEKDPYAVWQGMSQEEAQKNIDNLYKDIYLRHVNHPKDAILKNRFLNTFANSGIIGLYDKIYAMVDDHAQNQMEVMQIRYGKDTEAVQQKPKPEPTVEEKKQPEVKPAEPAKGPEPKIEAAQKEEKVEAAIVFPAPEGEELNNYEYPIMSGLAADLLENLLAAGVKEVTVKNVDELISKAFKKKQSQSSFPEYKKDVESLRNILVHKKATPYGLLILEYRGSDFLDVIHFITKPIRDSVLKRQKMDESDINKLYKALGRQKDLYQTRKDSKDLSTAQKNQIFNSLKDGYESLSEQEALNKGFASREDLYNTWVADATRNVVDDFINTEPGKGITESLYKNIIKARVGIAKLWKDIRDPKMQGMDFETLLNTYENILSAQNAAKYFDDDDKESINKIRKELEKKLTAQPEKKTETLPAVTQTGAKTPTTQVPTTQPTSPATAIAPITNTTPKEKASEIIAAVYQKYRPLIGGGSDEEEKAFIQSFKQANLASYKQGNIKDLSLTDENTIDQMQDEYKDLLKKFPELATARLHPSKETMEQPDYLYQGITPDAAAKIIQDVYGYSGMWYDKKITNDQFIKVLKDSIIGDLIDKKITIPGLSDRAIKQVNEIAKDYKKLIPEEKKTTQPSEALYEGMKALEAGTIISKIYSQYLKYRDNKTDDNADNFMKAYEKANLSALAGDKPISITGKLTGPDINSLEEMKKAYQKIKLIKTPAEL